jgi:hypothetical protein
MDREAHGRLVRDTFVAWANEQPDPKPSWLVPWDELEPGNEVDAGQREVDMRIGEAVAAAERARLSRTISLAAARLRDAADGLDSQSWAGREHLAGSSFQAVCWCQIAHTAQQARALNETGEEPSRA